LLGGLGRNAIGSWIIVVVFGSSWWRACAPAVSLDLEKTAASGPPSLVTWTYQRGRVVTEFRALTWRRWLEAAYVMSS
jgi:hypothetical protein